MTAKVISAAQTGILLSGPGGSRLNDILSNLVALTPEQQELVNKAKRYALEQSAKSIFTKQTAPTNQQQQQKTNQRHQALVTMCRVYVGSISFEVKEETIKSVFSPFGAIKSIKLSYDQVTMKHKGFAFVEYELPEAAQLVLEHMNQFQLGGRQIKVGRPSNTPQAAPIIQQIQEEFKAKNRIYVSNIHPDLSEPDLALIFEPFGKVLSIKLAMTPDVDKPQHRGYCFVEFDTEEAATGALTLNNLELGGQVLHACRATTPSEYLSIYGTLGSESMVISQTASSAGNNNLLDEDIQMQLERANKEQQDDQSTTGDQAASGRDDGSNISYEDNEPSNTNGLSQDESVSNIIVLRNMVKHDDELDDSLQLDVYEECGKYGPVSQVLIYLDKGVEESGGSNDEVKIFVKYKNSLSSQRAREALDGRFFAGRRVSAEHYDRTTFRQSDYSR